MYDLKELGLLASALVVRKIPFTFEKCLDGWRIIEKQWGVAINYMTMGSADGLLELEIWNESVWNESDGIYGCKTASEIIEILENKGLFIKKVVM